MESKPNQKLAGNRDGGANTLAKALKKIRFFDGIVDQGTVWRQITPIPETAASDHRAAKPIARTGRGCITSLGCGRNFDLKGEQSRVHRDRVVQMDRGVSLFVSVGVTVDVRLETTTILSDERLVRSLRYALTPGPRWPYE